MAYKPERVLLRPIEAAEMLGMHRDTVYRLISSGRLRAGKQQGGIYLLVEDVKAYAEKLVSRTMDDREMVEQIKEGGLKELWNK